LEGDIGIKSGRYSKWPSEKTLSEMNLPLISFKLSKASKFETYFHEDFIFNELFSLNFARRFSH
jgi:hypothetical protein